MLDQVDLSRQLGKAEYKERLGPLRLRMGELVEHWQRPAAG